MTILSRKTVFKFLVLLLLLGIVAGAIHYYWRRQAQDYMRHLQARGEKLLVAELTPPPIQAGQNSAATFQQAEALLGTNSGVLETDPPRAMRTVAPGKAMVGWAQPGVPDVHNRGTNTWKEVEEALAENDGAIKLLQQIIDHPALDFDLDYSRQKTPSARHLLSLNKAAQILCSAALCDLHRGDATSAVTNVRAILALAKGLKEERQVAFQATRIAIARIASAASWELLQAPNLTDPGLASMQNDWLELDFLQAAENALAMERASAKAAIESFRKLKLSQRLDFVPGQTGDWLGRAKVRSQELAWRAWWSYPDETRAFQGYQVLLDSSRLVKTNYAFRSTIFKQRNNLAELGLKNLAKPYWWEAGPADRNLRTVFSQSVDSCSSYLEMLEKVEITKQMTLSAIALKRYQLRHGNYAPELAALVPDFLPAAPRDPVDGKPLRYQLAGKTFLLYSIGDDGVDNGGDPVPASVSEILRTWLQGRDYVWPDPATEKDAQSYERRLSFGPK